MSYQWNSKYSIETAIEVARKIDSGELSYRKAQQIYGIQAQGTVWKWVKNYRSGKLTLPPMLQEYTGEDTAEVLAYKLRISEESLKLANLHVETLKTVIDQAEKELKIDLRKKYFTQRSKK
ncbi:transposase [Fluviicola chungangensis]|uniref:Transposase n=1 Tax=Fluviicola chungangensis TaxID=2597671 RepID=A0A556MGG7_9FLAO|nr:transposase [Fluviicola chungangensis]TSJ38949.1 transposase [Fluviicola chungangensis]